MEVCTVHVHVCHHVVTMDQVHVFRAVFRILWKGGGGKYVSGNKGGAKSESPQTVSISTRTRTTRGVRAWPPRKLYIFRGPELTLDAFLGQTIIHLI